MSKQPELPPADPALMDDQTEQTGLLEVTRDPWPIVATLFSLANFVMLIALWLAR